MADEKPTRTPPYIPFKTFDNTIKGLSASGVPSKLDRSVLSTMSGSGRSSFLVGMRFLGLVDSENHTQPLLEALVHSEGDTRKAILGEILRVSYGFLSQEKLDLKRATGSQLAEAMGAEGASGGTREKAVAFFLKAAEEAGIEVSPHILKRKHIPAGPSKPRTPKAKKPANERQAVANSIAPPAFAAAQKPSAMLLDHFAPNEMDDTTQNAIWTLIKYFKGKDL